MHDPQVVAFEIKAPWFRRWANGEKYHPTLVTIWHVDPEKDGSDDSCGWSFPKLTKAQRKRIKDWAWHEGHYPHFLREESKEWTGSIAEVESLYRGVVMLTARCIGLRMSFDEASAYTVERVHNGGVDGVSRNFCWLPGWHCNGKDHHEKRSDHFAGIMAGIARDLLRRRRPWYRHPRWHVHHWKLQIHVTQQLKRWLFSRCASCGGRFTYGYSPTSHSWYGTGPRWFRSERDVHHSECAGRNVSKEAA